MMCPAQSNVNPLSTSDRHHPPPVSSAAGGGPSSPRWYAAVRPAGPARITTTGGVGPAVPAEIEAVGVETAGTAGATRFARAAFAISPAMAAAVASQEVRDRTPR